MVSILTKDVFCGATTIRVNASRVKVLVQGALPLGTISLPAFPDLLKICRDHCLSCLKTRTKSLFKRGNASSVMGAYFSTINAAMNLPQLPEFQSHMLRRGTASCLEVLGLKDIALKQHMGWSANS